MLSPIKTNGAHSLTVYLVVLEASSISAILNEDVCYFPSYVFPLGKDIMFHNFLNKKWSTNESLYELRNVRSRKEDRKKQALESE